MVRSISQEPFKHVTGVASVQSITLGISNNVLHHGDTLSVRLNYAVRSLQMI